MPTAPQAPQGETSVPSLEDVCTVLDEMASLSESIITESKGKSAYVDRLPKMQAILNQRDQLAQKLPHWDIRPMPEADKKKIEAKLKACNELDQRVNDVFGDDLKKLGTQLQHAHRSRGILHNYKLQLTEATQDTSA